jgi:hypothetical protein
MSFALARPPEFGGKLQTDQYYAQTNQIISTLRGKATIRTICDHMNACGIKTPTGLTWNRVRLTNYLQSTAYAVAAE